MHKSFQLPDYPAFQFKTNLDKQIKEILEKFHIVGAELAVIKDNKTVFSKGYGFSNLSKKTPITDNTIIRLASISKMFTGTAIMQLYEQGKVNLHEDISKYLGFNVINPGFPKVPVTIAMLLSHTSSIVDSGTYDNIVESNYSDLANISLKNILLGKTKYTKKSNFADYPPGTNFTYSNLGIGIIGSIIESISGTRFPDFCRRYIFNPLKMDASFDPGDIKNHENIGVLYKPEKNGKELKFLPKQDNYNGEKPLHTINNLPTGNALAYSPAGSARTNISDLTHFVLMLINKGKYNNEQVLIPQTIDLMIKSHCSGNSSRKLYKSYGYTMHQTDSYMDNVVFTGHSAEAYGLIGTAYFIPDKKFAIIELFTGGNYGSPEIFYTVETDISKILYNKFSL